MGPTGRLAGDTEKGWCRGVPGGTGISVAAAQFSSEIPHETLTSALHHLQLHHPILRSKLSKPTPTTFHLSPSPSPTSTLLIFSSATTSDLLSRIPNRSDSPLHALAEHEMNLNPWADSDSDSDPDSDPVDVLFGSVYDLGSDGVVFVIRVHAAVADRTSVRSVLKEVFGVVAGKFQKEVEVKRLGPPMEELIPEGLEKKAIWARGFDMFGYSWNHARSSILEFDDTEAERATRFVALEVDAHHTHKLLAKCKDKGIKLCGVLLAAALIAIIKSKQLPNQKSENNQTIMLSDCRKRLTGDLSDDDMGFYHSAIQNVHSVNGEENIWDLSTRCYTNFANAQSCNKDLTDMADLNFLMMKAIDNPGMTPSGSLRTAVISVFDEPQLYDSTEFCQGLDVKDYVVTSSIHGIGTCLALFDAIKDGGLFCGCLYASPLYSRMRVQGIVDDMKKILIDATA